MKPEAIILYLEANGITVTGSTDQYFRLSPSGIKSWTNSAPQPTEQDLAPYELEVAKPTVEQIKAEAGRRILLLMPEWKQRNYTARMTELLKIRTLNGSWTTQEQAEVDFLEGEWNKAKAIREASNVLESALPIDYMDDDHWTG